MVSLLKYLILAGLMCAMLEVETLEAQIQRPRRFSLGVYGGFGADLNMANFLELPTAPIFTPRGSTYDPAPFSDATTIGTWAAGIVMEYQINDQLSVALRGNYATQNSALRTTATYRVGRSDGTFDDATSEYTLNTTIQLVGLEPMVGYTIVEGLNVHLGARVNFVVASSYNQKETLIAPADGGFFTNGVRVRNERTGELPEVNNLTVAPLAGLSYTIPVIDRLTVSPEAFFAFGLMPVVTNLPETGKWTTSSARAGISVKYKF